MNLSSYEGIMLGGDVLSEPLGVPLLGQTNRDGPCVEVSDDGITVLTGEHGCELTAVGLIGAWVDAGAPESEAFEYGKASLTFERDVLRFFTEDNLWFDGAQACKGCHFANTDNSYHEMNLSSYECIMLGGDVLSEPLGVPLNYIQSPMGGNCLMRIQ